MSTTKNPTFPVVGKGVRRNAETGIEIRSSKLDRGGMEHAVYAPDAEHGFRLVDYFGELTSARECGIDHAERMRERIAADHAEALTEADRIEQAEADAEQAAEAADGLPVRFRSTFSADLAGIEFRIVSTVRVAAESEGGYAFVTLRTFVKADTRSGLRAAYRTAKLDDLRTLDGGRVVAEVSAPAADPEIEAEAEEANGGELTEYARKQFPSVAAMIENAPAGSAHGAPDLRDEPALPKGVELIEFGAAEESAYVYMLSGIEVEHMPKMGIAKRPQERKGGSGQIPAGWAVRIGDIEIDRKRTKRDARARLDQWLAAHLARITKTAAEEAPPVVIAHRDEVVFATTSKDMPEPIPGAAKVTPWTLDGTDEPMYAPGGRVFVYVWQTFTDPAKGFSGRLAPAWLDELRTPDGRRVTLTGL